MSIRARYFGGTAIRATVQRLDCDAEGISLRNTGLAPVTIENVQLCQPSTALRVGTRGVVSAPIGPDFIVPAGGIVGPFRLRASVRYAGGVPERFIELEHVQALVDGLLIVIPLEHRLVPSATDPRLAEDRGT